MRLITDYLPVSTPFTTTIDMQISKLKAIESSTFLPKLNGFRYIDPESIKQNHKDYCLNDPANDANTYST